MPIGPRKIGSPEVSTPRGTPVPAKPTAPVATAPVGLEASNAATESRRASALAGTAQPAPPVSATMAIAFDSIKAPGDRKFHTKSAVIDDEDTVVSTRNLGNLVRNHVPHFKPLRHEE